MTTTATAGVNKGGSGNQDDDNAASVDLPATWTAGGESVTWLDETTVKLATTTKTDYNAYTPLTTYCSISANSSFTITLNKACTVKVSISGDNNTANKGTVTAKSDSTSIGTYSLPARKNTTATPFIFNITAEQAKSGVTLTTTYNALLYKIELVETSE